MSGGRSSTNTRTPSVTRPMPPTSTNGVSTIQRAIHMGSMNVTTSSVRSRPLTGSRHEPTSRPTVSVTHIPSTIPSSQRRLSNDAARTRQPSQDRSVSWKILSNIQSLLTRSVTKILSMLITSSTFISLRLLTQINILLMEQLMNHLLIIENDMNRATPIRNHQHILLKNQRILKLLPLIGQIIYLHLNQN